MLPGRRPGPRRLSRLGQTAVAPVRIFFTIKIARSFFFYRIGDNSMTAEYKVDGAIAVITLNNPPVNGLGLSTRRGIVEGLDKAYSDPAVKAIVITGAGKARSEERRVGKECRSRWSPYH